MNNEAIVKCQNPNPSKYSGGVFFGAQTTIQATYDAPDYFSLQNTNICKIIFLHKIFPKYGFSRRFSWYMFPILVASVHLTETISVPNVEILF
jgi:hypothetical protein